MTKVELIASVAAEAGMSKKDAEKAVNAALAAITEELKNGGKFRWLALAPLKSASARNARAATRRPKSP